MFPLSGVAFMVHWLPPEYREAVLWLPMVNGLEILREGYFGDVVPTHYDVGYLAEFCAGLTFFGLAVARIAGRHVEPE
jgi:ABC-type polysaccharide/polyol phosphate export permease